MKIEFKNNEIILDKKLNTIDYRVLDFSELLARNNIKYVILSTYIPVLLGRDRICEEIDLLIKNIAFETFLKFWLEIENTYECKNTDDPIDAYNAYMKNHHTVGIVRKEGHFPEFKIRTIKNEIDRYILKYRKKVIVDNRELYISPFEIQIPLCFSSGSREDIDDAGYLYELAGKQINRELMERLFNELKIPQEGINNYFKP